MSSWLPPVAECTWDVETLSIPQQIQHRIAALLEVPPKKQDTHQHPRPLHRPPHNALEALHRRRMRRHIRQVQRMAVHFKTKGLEAVSPLPVVASGQECVICMEAMVSSRLNLRLLPCGHLYHRPCIEAWSTYQCTCPFDRMPFQR
ncbi:Aste57867_22990 [Aphanomyces stellatus]|uniref:Aste57867_22990 protein n=1 Tax=Aphanomyces stellatus TaxID=120398 RepID=A0A485LLI3_9STRA|nr:hypothetical protein As57867_022919 [Aphanomyces stellatus]VFT99639.1 Aste57867_22990 [Aphanomyces stellatus]